MKIIKGVFLLSLFTFGFSKIAFSQCAVTASASSISICVGSPVQLVSTGSCGLLMFNDFNNGTVGAGWSSNAIPMFNNPCGAGLAGSGIHCWIGSATDFPRELITLPFLFTDGCSVNFQMRYAADENAVDCEDPDLVGEGVHLQYSLPPYSSWVDIQYWTPNSSQTGPLYVWNNYSVLIPAAALGPSTKIRWYQDVTSGNTYDHWGIDEVQIGCPSGTSILWSTGDTIANPIVYPTGDSTFIVTYYDLINGYSATDSVFIDVKQIPTSDFNVVSPICTDLFSTINYTGTGSSAASFTWLFSGGNVLSGSGDGPYNISWANSGTMYISLQVTDSGCVSPYTYDSVIVNPTPVAAFVADDINGCDPHTVNFTDLSNPSGTIWNWTLGDGSNSTIQNPSHTYTTPGLYDVTLAVATPEGCNDTLTYTNYIEIYEQPIANISADPLSTSIMDPEITFNSNSMGVSDWLWNFDDPGSMLDNTSILPPTVTHIFSTDGQFLVMLIVTSANGCTDTAYINVEVIAEPSFYNIITPDGNGQNDVFEILNAERIPNELVVFNRWGKKVFEAINYQNDWDGGDLSDGTYYYIFIYGVELQNEYQGTLTIMRK